MHMFNLNDRVVYPGYGVAIINKVINKKVGGDTTSFYELKFLSKDTTILVPVSNQKVIRPLTSPDKLKDIFDFLARPARRTTMSDMPTNWKQRNKDYQSKLRTGNLMDISSIYRELKQIEKRKDLSFCEKNLLTQTEMLLAEELALVQSKQEEKVIEQLRSLFGRNMSQESTRNSSSGNHQTNVQAAIKTF